MSEYIPMLNQEELDKSYFTPFDDSGCPKPRINPQYLLLPGYKDYYQFTPQIDPASKIEEPPVVFLFFCVLLVGLLGLILSDMWKRTKEEFKKPRRRRRGKDEL